MVSDRLKRVILTELGLDDFDLQDGTLATTVPGWDSLSHVRVLVAVEKEYGIRLKALEVLRLKNVGDLQRLVEAKTNPPA
jgi:acyl carrier protein